MRYHGVTINSEKLLSNLGLRGRPSGHNLYTSCPLHSDRTPSFAINIDNGSWICFSGPECGAGNLTLLVKKVIGCSELEAHQWLMEQSESDINYVKELLNPSKEKDIPVEVIDDSLLNGDIPRWFLERGFDEDDIARWKIKFEPSTGSIIIPVGKGFIRRWPPGSFKRYEYSAGFNRKNELFGFNRLLEKSGSIESLMITEGSLDTMWAVKYGFDSVAILGAHMSEHQIKKIAQLNPQEVILAFDSDEAGRKVTISVAQQNRNRLNLYYLQLPTGYKDIQELSGPLLKQLMHHTKPISLLRLKQEGPFSGVK